VVALAPLPVRQLRLVWQSGFGVDTELGGQRRRAETEAFNRSAGQLRAMTDIDRRRLLAVGGAGLLAGFAGCSRFDDTTGVPGREGDTGEDREAFGPAE